MSCAGLPAVAIEVDLRGSIQDGAGTDKPGCICRAADAEQGPGGAGQHKAAEMNDTSGSAALAPPPPAEPAAARPKLRPLRLLVPYVMRYRGRALLALVALVVASFATLVVPVAIRRMIDFGFSAE